jgi:protein O-GlcNAc transferase
MRNSRFQQALAAFQSGKLDDAVPLFKSVVDAEPRHIGALNLLGAALTQLGRLAEAERFLRLALQEQPASETTLYNYGVVLKALDRPAEALERFNQALTINASVPETWNNRGATLNALKRYEEAVADFDRAIALNPKYAEAFCNKGNSLTKLKRRPEALSAFETALALKPALAEAWHGGGNILVELKRYDDALAAYDRALALNPGLAEAWLGRGNIFSELKRYADAVDAYDRAIASKPDVYCAASYRLHDKMQMCDWANTEHATTQVLASVRAGKDSNAPFAMLAIPSSSADQLQCAKRYLQDIVTFPGISSSQKYRHDRLRIAYLSADFGEHATAYLLAPLFERHDRKHFEVTGISFGPDTSSAMRQRIESAFDRFIDVRQQSEPQIAELVRCLEVDIAIDLMGHTQNGRPGIFAYRPAPVQVNYLGYLGTTGADFMDYVIADKTVLPFEQQQYYSEMIVHLPDCFLPNDDRLPISPHIPSREDVGLPANGFVFCSFNNGYKLNPSIFDVWMRLLRRVEKSVLWLVGSNPEMMTNLRQETQKRQVDPSRIVFAPRVPLSDHLARQQLADLFLDTIPYNGGATVSAALWSGLPVLTTIGETFVGRMATSMLRNVGLPELVTSSLLEYEALALRIAEEPELHRSLKHKLAGNCTHFPLFDTDQYVRHLETAYEHMARICRQGLPPKSFVVESPVST